MKIAVIKIGATGDVVRTSILFHLFKDDEITWITAKMNIAVLPFQQLNLRNTIAIEDIKSPKDLSEQFDLIISLDDDLKCASLASSIKSKDIFGAYAKNGKVVYTESANEWFDMGLSSRFGKQRADEIKWENKATYQEILFRMLGYTFKGEEYIIREDVKATGADVIGIEARAGTRWPTKVWNQYEKLAIMLREQGCKVIFFEEKPTIAEYMQDIGKVNLWIGGDTLGMHVALALKIPTVTIFTCTSAVEIYGYRRMEKVISPYLKEAFYKTVFMPEAIDSISLSVVQAAISRLQAISISNDYILNPTN